MLNSIRCLTTAVPPARRHVGRLRLLAAEAVGLALAALLLNALPAAPALAQDAGPPQAANEKVIITPPPQGSRLRAALSKLLGRDKREALGNTKSEVWTVPQARLEGLKARFKELGLKVTQLREDWNHILRRQRSE